MIFGILCAFAAAMAVDLPAMLRRPEKRELVVYFLVFAAAIALAVLMTSGVEIPSTVDALGQLFERIFGKGYPV